MTDYLAALRAYTERDQHSPHASRRPRRGRLLDAGGHDRFFRIPAPRHLARLLVSELLEEEGAAFRLPDGTLVRRPHGSTGAPTPVALGDLVARVVEVLRGMPELPWTPAHEAYTYLRTFAELAPAAGLEAYARAAVTALGGSTSPLPLWRTPKPPRPTSTKTRADYAADERARADADTRAVLLKLVPALNAGRYRLDEVWAYWEEQLDRAHAKVAPLYPGAYLTGRTRFYALLDELFDVQPGGSRRRYLVIAAKPIESKEPLMNPETLWETAVALREVTDARRDETAAIHAQADAVERLLGAQAAQLAAGDRAGALHTQAERLATSTDGAPVDLSAYRAARAG